MSSGMYVALSGALSRLRELDVLANNLANVETAGFKRERPIFAVALETSIADLTRERVEGAPGRVFTKTQATRLDLAPGPVAHTGNPLDVALEGPGFFVVETSAGPRYTRAGSFVIDPDGLLATPDGLPVLGTGGPLATGGRSVELRSSGALVDDQDEELGRLRIVDFEDPNVLSKEGGSLFRAPDDVEPLPLPDAQVTERSLEGSNARPVEELASLVVLQRSFDAAMRMLQSEDQATAQLIREVST